MKHTLKRPDKLRELSEIDGALRAALGALYKGASTTPTALTLHFADEASMADRTRAEAVLQTALDAIDPSQPSPAQARQQRRERALKDVQAADFKAIYGDIAALSGAALAIKPILIWMLRMIYSLALAQGLTDKAAPDDDGSDA